MPVAARLAAGRLGAARAGGHVGAAAGQAAARRHLAWAGLLFMGLFSSLLVLTVLRDALAAAGWIVSLIAPWPCPWPACARSRLPPCPCWARRDRRGLPEARRTARVVRVEIPHRGPAAGPARLHHRPDQRHPRRPDDPARYMEAIVEAVNRLEPDLVAITGDLVDGSRGRARRRRSRRWPRLRVAARQLLRHRQPRVLLRRARPGWPSCAGWASRCCTTSMW